jgi:cell division protein FtsL
MEGRRMILSGLFRRRVRGFRIVELTALGVLLVLVLVVYLAKTFAGRERTEIAGIEKEISQEQERVRLLQAEVAFLEQPERLERLSRQYLGMAPIGAKAEADPDGLIEIAAREMKPGSAPAEAAQ